jgi:purine-binding chemotaxis protein CheW
LASTASISDGTATRSLLFRVGNAVYGCDIARTQEIIPSRPITRMPGAPAHVRGLINVRGAIVTVLDLARRLDPSAAPAGDGFVILLRRGNRLVGVAVDEVLDVRAVVRDPMPGGTVEGGLVQGIGRADDTSVILIDLDLLAEQAFVS